MSLDFKKLSEPFDPREIDWRVGQAGTRDGKVWAKVLAYIDARAVMDRLDEVVGSGNWKDRYWKEGSGEMCGLSIRVDGEWVEKVDGSEETDIEAFKGGISKALVRAGVKWGIGRYLYRLGDGWAKIVPAGTEGARWQPKDAKNGKYEAFNWLPPDLPEWAVPESLRRGAPSPKAVVDEPGATLVPFGEVKGMRLDTLSEEQLASIANWYAKMKEPPKGVAAAFKKDFDAFIAWRNGPAHAAIK